MDLCTHFLVILSAASTRAEWVLEEIRLAQAKRDRTSDFTVLPLVVGRLDNYAGASFINTLQAVPYYDDFAAQVEAVAAALKLRPVPPARFRSLIEERTEEFVGRDYVFAAIDRFLSRRRKGYFAVEGDPGVGKSAILAEFVRRTGCIAHFNIRSQGITQASQFLESVCTQIIARYDLPYSSLPTHATSDGTFLSALLDQVSEQLGEVGRLVIGVDALDEVDLAAQRPGANILYLPGALPPGVYFVMTRRQLKLPFVVQAPQVVLDLGAYPAESLRDVQTYIRRAAKRPALRDRIGGRPDAVETFVTELARKSESNFMYLHHVLPEIERGGYRDLQFDDLPSGLDGYYDDHWGRMGMTAKPLPQPEIKIIYVLAEVRQPVSRALISEFAGEDALTVQEVLDNWESFIHKQRAAGETLYSFYHTSFRDFLHRKDIVGAAGLTLKEVNAAIADNLYDGLFEGE
jgi:hypothetical protein